jgi:polysaccharide chain length determinant protein (PEP-CTERM system associated)
MVQRELTTADYLAMLRRHWVLVVVLTVVGGPLAYAVSRFLPSRYKSQTLVLIEQPTVPTRVVEPVVTMDISQRLASMQQQILSRTRLEPVIRQFGLYAGDVNRVPMEDLVARLQKAIEVTPIQPMAETRTQQLPGFYIGVTLESARTAQEVCTTITSMFIEENLRLRQQHSEDTTQFLEQQLTEAKVKLDEQDGKLAAFKSRYLGSLPDEEQANLNLLMGLTSQLDAATQALARAQQDKAFTESMLTQQVAAWEASKSGHNPETLEQQLTALQNQLTSLQARYTDDYPDVIKTKTDIEVLKKKIAENEKEKGQEGLKKNATATVEPLQITQLRAQIHTQEQVIAEKSREQEQIKHQIQIYQDRVQSSPAVEQQYKELTRGYQAALDTYNDLQKKRDQSAMATDLERRQEGEQFRVLDPANLPDKPSFPNRLLFALSGFGGGLAIGLALAFVFEMQDTSLRSERDVESVLRLPVLATIPAMEPLAVLRREPLGLQLRRKFKIGNSADA